MSDSTQNKTKSVISTPSAPQAIGPYSQAIRAGDFVFTSGQIALDAATGQLVSGGVEEQTRCVMQNLEAVLRAAGAGFANVVRTQIFLVDMNDFQTVNAVYGSYFEGLAPPARSTVQVSRLPKDVQVEIDMVAYVP